MRPRNAGTRSGAQGPAATTSASRAIGAAVRQADRRAVEIDLGDPAVGVQGHALLAQPAAEILEDARGEQHAAGRREQGEAGVLEAAERAGARRAPRATRSRPAAPWPRGRAAMPRTQPSSARATTRVPVGSKVASAEVRPEAIPGGMGLVDHARIAGHGAVGEPGQPMLVARGGERVRDRSLLVHDRARARRDGAPRPCPGP